MFKFLTKAFVNQATTPTDKPGDTHDKQEEHYKIAVVGAPSIKPSFVVQFIREAKFDDEYGYDATLEDNHCKYITVDDVECTVEIRSAHEEYKALRDQYMRTSDGFIVIFSVSDRRTFEEVSDLHDRILRVKDTDFFPVLLVGHDNFGLHEQRVVDEVEIAVLSQTLGIPYIEASVKMKYNISEAFTQLVREIRKHKYPSQQYPPISEAKHKPKHRPSFKEIVGTTARAVTPDLFPFFKVDINQTEENLAIENTDSVVSESIPSENASDLQAVIDSTESEQLQENTTLTDSTLDERREIKSFERSDVVDNDGEDKQEGRQIESSLTSKLRSYSSRDVVAFVKRVNYSDLKRIRFIGRGSFGEVYLAKWTSANLEVAVKEVLVGNVDDNLKEEFFSEIEILANLRHPNVVQIYGYAIEEEKGILCVIMEYIDGGNLRAHLRSVVSKISDNRDREAQQWKIAQQLALSILYLKGMKTLHRDLKSANILVEKSSGRLKLCDFGLSKTRTTTTINSTKRSTSGAGKLIGTLNWIPPEVFSKGAKAYGNASEVYAMGMVLYEIATFQIPYQGMPDDYIFLMVKNGQLPSYPDDSDPDDSGSEEENEVVTVPTDFKELIAKCCCLRRSDRMPVEKVVEFIERYVQE